MFFPPLCALVQISIVCLFYEFLQREKQKSHKTCWIFHFAYLNIVVLYPIIKQKKGSGGGQLRHLTALSVFIMTCRYQTRLNKIIIPVQIRKTSRVKNDSCWDDFGGQGWRKWRKRTLWLWFLVIIQVLCSGFVLGAVNIRVRHHRFPRFICWMRE